MSVILQCFYCWQFLLFTQFIRFQVLLFFAIISWILILKNKYLVFLMTPLKIFQFSIVLENLYLVNLSWHFSFYYVLECLVTLTYQENLYQIVYLDNTLIFTWTLKYYCKVVHIVLARYKLFLCLEKYKFNKWQVEYLKLVVMT